MSRPSRQLPSAALPRGIVRPAAQRIAALAFLVAAPLQAQVTVGNPPYGMHCGFFCNFGQTRYQQVYDASAFSGPLTITNVLFERYPLDVAPFIAPKGTYTLYIGTTSKPVDGLSTDFDENATGPEAFFMTVTDPVAITEPNFTGPACPYNPFPCGGFAGVLFTGTPYMYDPTQGNLLLDFHLDRQGSIGQGPGGTLSSTTTLTGIAFDRVGILPARIAVVGGPVTTFNAAISTVPEPSTYLLLGAGLAGLALAARRRRATRT